MNVVRDLDDIVSCLNQLAGALWWVEGQSEDAHRRNIDGLVKSRMAEAGDVFLCAFTQSVKDPKMVPDVQAVVRTVERMTMQGTIYVCQHPKVLPDAQIGGIEMALLIVRRDGGFDRNSDGVVTQIIGPQPISEVRFSIEKGDAPDMGMLDRWLPLPCSVGYRSAKLGRFLVEVSPPVRSGRYIIGTCGNLKMEKT